MPDEPSKPARQANPDVLVIDDNEGFARLVTAALSGVGCRVEHAAGGWEGLKRVAERPPALILLDLHMPEMDGLGVLRRLKARPPFDQIPVIVVTASQTIDDATTACRLGAKDYITKPLNPADLVTKALRNLPSGWRRAGTTTG